MEDYGYKSQVKCCYCFTPSHECSMCACVHTSFR